MARFVADRGTRHGKPRAIPAGPPEGGRRIAGTRGSRSGAIYLVIFIAPRTGGPETAAGSGTGD